MEAGIYSKVKEAPGAAQNLEDLAKSYVSTQNVTTKLKYQALILNELANNYKK